MANMKVGGIMGKGGLFVIALFTASGLATWRAWTLSGAHAKNPDRPPPALTAAATGDEATVHETPGYGTVRDPAANEGAKIKTE